jgi:hypothetical protein
MAYIFGAANADKIAFTTAASWTDKYTIAARLKVASAGTGQRGIAYVGPFFDFPSTNDLRIGYQASDSSFPIVNWFGSAFVDDAVHTVVGVIDTTVGGAVGLQFYADTDATAKALAAAPLGPLNGAIGGTLGGDGTAASLNGILYEVGIWVNVALTGAEAALLGGGGSQVGVITPPAHYWGLVADAFDTYGGAHGTVTGASVVAHTGTNWFPSFSSSARRRDGILLGLGVS